MLKVNHLKTYFYNKSARRFIRAVDDVSFNLARGETLGLIGESGCGKTVTAKAIIGLIREFPGVIAGEILFDDGQKGQCNLLEGLKVDLDRDENGNIIRVEKDNVAWLKKIDERMRQIRGKSISMIFQEPTIALNPLMTVGEQLKEVIRKNGTPKSEATDKAECWLNRVQLDSPKECLEQYPWELSGGMCQRVMIALALCSAPALLIADEPTTNLDATTQALIINLLEDLTSDEKQRSMLLITHDLGIVSRLASNISVMYAGVTIEFASKSDILNPKKDPKHPYTTGLLNAVQTTQAIKGEVPSPEEIPRGCRFYKRCDRSIPSKCEDKGPEFIEIEQGHYIRCWRYEC